MAFDIYGNRLSRGYCEVHPHVPEPYPCHLCIAAAQREDDYYKAMDEQYEDLKRRHYEEMQENTDGAGIEQNKEQTNV